MIFYNPTTGVWYFESMIKFINKRKPTWRLISKHHQKNRAVRNKKGLQRNLGISVFHQGRVKSLTRCTFWRRASFGFFISSHGCKHVDYSIYWRETSSLDEGLIYGLQQIFISLDKINPTSGKTGILSKGIASEDDTSSRVIKNVWKNCSAFTYMKNWLRMPNFSNKNNKY